MWQQSETYPDPAVEVLDPRFLKYRITNAAVERLATGMRFGEGPVWFGDGRFLLWSDIPNNRIMRWDEESARRRYFANPRGMRTAIHGTARGGSSPASTATGA
jgi:gluconolactonase